jgi:hypothetical protein
MCTYILLCTNNIAVCCYPIIQVSNYFEALGPMSWSLFLPILPTIWQQNLEICSKTNVTIIFFRHMYINGCNLSHNRNFRSILLVKIFFLNQNIDPRLCGLYTYIHTYIGTYKVVLCASIRLHTFCLCVVGTSFKQQALFHFSVSSYLNM